MEKNWFTIKKIKKNIWGIAEFKHFEKVISYLFIGKNFCLLFDTGMGIGDIKKEVRKLTTLPVVVVNSHFHYDHVGGNNSFENTLARKTMGKLLTIQPFQFVIIPTPGHTPDSICLFEKNNNYLLTGDTLYPGPIYLQFQESNLDEYIESINKLGKLKKINKIFPGHNAFTLSPTVIKEINNKTPLIRKRIKNLKFSRSISFIFPEDLNTPEG